MLLPRAYGFYNSLLKMRITYLYCITLILIALSSGSWWYFVYQPSIDAIDSMQQQISQIHAQINQLRKTEKTLLGLSQSIDAQNIQKHSESKMRKVHAQESLSLLADCATNSGVGIESFKVCSTHDESWCCIIDMSGDFKGSLDQIISFFDALRNTKQIIDVCQCEIARVDTNIFSLHALFNVYCV